MTTTALEHVRAEEESHHVPYSTYVKIWGTLIGLTALTVFASYLNLHHLATFTAILIAGVKSSLVLLFFMHLRFEKRLFTWMFLTAIGAYVIFIVLTFADYAFR